MTPILIGRWQTRLALSATLGVVVTAILGGLIGSYQFDKSFLMLGYMFIVGAIGDPIYIGLQRLRWDRDWPTSFQVVAGIIEGLVLFNVIFFLGLPGIMKGSLSEAVFASHFGLVWIVTFIWMQGPMRTLFPRWRLNGGRII